MAWLGVMNNMNKTLLFFLSFLSFASYALQRDAKQPIEIEADSVVVDERKGLSVYTGNAKITQGSLMLSAEKIQLFNTQKKVTKMIAIGTKNKRAHYKQNQPNQQRFIEASALNITYFIQQQILHLKGRAHLLQGFDSFKGSMLNYDIKNNKVVAKQSKDGTQRVRFKIRL